MRLFSYACLGLILFSTAIVADEQSEKQIFKEAYQAYQAAMKAGDTADARAAAKTAYETGRKIYGPNHKNTAALALNYGTLAPQSEAVGVLREALVSYEAVYGPESIELISPLLALAKAEATPSDIIPAQKHYSRALDLAENIAGENSDLAGQVNLEIGRISLGYAQSTYASKYLRKAAKIFESLEGDKAKSDLAITNFWLGKYHMAAHKYGSATKVLLEALETLEDIAPSSQMTMTNHAFLIQAYEKRGMRDEATQHCLAIGRANPIDPNQDYQPVYRVQPKYPDSAAHRGQEGHVVVSVTVDKQGFVKAPKVIEAQGSRTFVPASLEAVEKFRYVPRFENGEAVDTTDVKYRFSYAIRKD